MTKLEGSIEISPCLVISVRPLNYRVVRVIHFSDGAALLIADIEAVVVVLLPRVTGQQTGKDAWFALWVFHLDNVPLPRVRVSSRAIIDGHVDGYVPELTYMCTQQSRKLLTSDGS